MMRSLKFAGRFALLAWFVGLGITLAVALAGAVFTNDSEARQQREYFESPIGTVPKPDSLKRLEASQKAQDAPKPASPDVGSECLIAAPTFLGRTWDDFEEAHTFAMAKDEVGLGTLIIQQRIEDLEPGTRVIVLELHFTTYRIRVLDGRQAGKDGYVYREALRMP